MKRLFALASGIVALVASQGQAQVIYDNGPLSTGPTTASGVVAPAGTTWSEVQDDGGTTCSNTNAGFSCGIVGVNLFRMADDFTVPAGQTWDINRICIYAYQTGSVTSNPVFTAANIQIWNGRPGDAGSTVIFGDTTTNRLASQAFDNMYRVFNTQNPPPGTPPGTTRGIRKLDLNLGVSLGPGTYWIDWQTSINNTAAHFAPSTTIVNQRGVAGANARQFTTLWADAIDAGNPATCPDVIQEIPFQLKGQIVGAGFQVTGFNPPQGGEGDIIQITGSGFGNNPDNICAVIMQGPENAIPLEVLQTTNNLITARIGPINELEPPVPGQVMVGLGTGDRGAFTPVFRDIIPEDPQGVWIWDRNGNPNMGVAPQPFLPIPRPPPPNIKYWHGRVMGGLMMVEIDGDWMPNTYVRVWARAHNHAMGMGADLAAFCIRFRLGGSAQHCAQRIADTIRCAFLRRGIVVNVQVQPVPGTNRWKITVIKKGVGGPVPIDWGTLIICAEMPRKINPFVWDPITTFFAADPQALANPPRALIGNIGSSGQDGATITPMMGPWTGGVRIELLPLSLQSANNSMTMTAWGQTQLMGPDRRLGQAGLRRLGSFFDVFADFSDIGGTQARVMIFNNSLQVADLVVPIGPTGQIGQLGPVPGTTALPRPNSCGKLPNPFPPLPPFPPCFWINFDNPFLFNGQFRGNSLRILVNNATDPIVNVQAFDIAAGLGGPSDGSNSYTITNVAEGGICYANCDGSVVPPILNVNDFACFLNRFSAGDDYANCDGSTTPPVLNVNDFSCFLNQFAAGCP
ncbi:MAG: GC-type dockerin domain-anchored protein [Phycisphaerales bacterium]